MASNNDAIFRTCLVWLAAFVAIVGLWTLSFKKMAVTYFIGLAGIAGIFLPDWEFFDRDISQWTRPVVVDSIKPGEVLRHGSNRFRFYPIRTLIYAAVYGYALYKWWTYVRQ